MLIIPRHGSRDGAVPTGNSTVAKWVPLVLAAIPLFWSVGVFAVGHVPQPMAIASPRASLVFEQHLVDAGPNPIEATEETGAAFRFTNQGAVPVTLVSWKPSCGCLQPQLRRAIRGTDGKIKSFDVVDTLQSGNLVFQPQEAGDFILRVRTANEMPGPREYSLAVKYDDGAEREANLTFRAILPEDQVLIRPRALIVFQLGNQSRAEEIVVLDKRKNPLEILGTRCSSDMVAVELGAHGIDENGQMQSRVRVSIPGSIPPGRHQMLLTLFTNDKAYPELKVPIIIEGPNGPQARRER